MLCCNQLLLVKMLILMYANEDKDSASFEMIKSEYAFPLVNTKNTNFGQSRFLEHAHSTFVCF